MFPETVAGGRLLWFPVFMGMGICAYFALPMEPPGWAGAVATGLAVVGFARSGGIIRQVLLFAAFAALGFGLMQARTAMVAAPVMDGERYFAELTGTVLWVDQRPVRQRVVLQVTEAGAGKEGRQGAQGLRARVTLLPNAPPPVIGQCIVLPAVLGPPRPPSMPGAFDFQRYAYFLRLGGLGYAVGGWQEAPGATEGATALSPVARFLLWADFWRGQVGQRITDALEDPEQAALARALMLGDRSGIAEPVLEAWRTAGLAHMLAISGLHMSLFAGLAFALIRRGLAWFPAVALRVDLKKVAAVGAFVAASVYLVLSGMNVPAQRAFMMVVVALAAILLDRQALSLHTLAVAALLIMVWRPEAVIGASFQMSFAAVLALISAYEAFRRWKRDRQEAEAAEAGEGDDKEGPWPRLRLYVLGIVVTTLVSEVATAPLGAYHFLELPTFGVVGNLPAMPILVFWVMPSAIAALLAMPVGLEAAPLWLMGQGLALITWVAEQIYALPGALWRPPPMSPAALGVYALGGAGLCLLRGWPRLVAGGVAFAGPLLIVWLTPLPDVLVSDDGELVALREGDGLVFSPGRGHRFVRSVWAERLGSSGRDWQGLMENGELTCDALGCMVRHRGWSLALPQTGEALAEDCARADVVMAPMPVRGACKGSGAVVIDRFDLWRSGAHAVFLPSDGGDDEAGGAVRIKTVRDVQGERLWSRFPPPFED